MELSDNGPIGKAMGNGMDEAYKGNEAQTQSILWVDEDVLVLDLLDLLLGEEPLVGDVNLNVHFRQMSSSMERVPTFVCPLQSDRQWSTFSICNLPKRHGG